jgi:hypothetical protein
MAVAAASRARALAQAEVVVDPIRLDAIGTGRSARSGRSAVDGPEIGEPLPIERSRSRSSENRSVNLKMAD